MSTERFKNVTSFVTNLLNNKTIILLNLAECRLILADSAHGLVGLPKTKKKKKTKKN